MFSLNQKLKMKLFNENTRKLTSLEACLMISFAFGGILLILINNYLHLEIDRNDFDVLTGMLAVVILVVLIHFFIFKSFRKIKEFYTKHPVKDFMIICFTSYLVNAFMYGMVFVNAFSFLNQFHASFPIEKIQTKVINKRIEKSRFVSQIIELTIPTKKPIEINNEILFGMLNIGDKVILEMQKGNFGRYFAVGMKIEKNKFEINL